MGLYRIILSGDGVRQDKDSIEVTEGEIKRAELQGSRN